MNHLKQSVTGIDVNIQRMQVDLYSYLLQQWGIGDNDYNCYGRCYKNPASDNGYVPEVYTSKGNYIEVMGEDKVKVQSFFGVSDEVTIGSYGGETANVHLIFALNLDKIKQAITHRADAEVKLDVFQILRMSLYGFEGAKETTGIEKVFAEYPGVRRDKLKNRDMQPYHWFRFDMKCTYDPNAIMNTPVSKILGKP